MARDPPDRRSAAFPVPLECARRAAASTDPESGPSDKTGLSYIYPLCGKNPTPVVRRTQGHHAMLMMTAYLGNICALLVSVGLLVGTLRFTRKAT